eukprot:1149374-Amphidinium_carterae.1
MIQLTILFLYLCTTGCLVSSTFRLMRQEPGRSSQWEHCAVALSWSACPPGTLTCAPIYPCKLLSTPRLTDHIQGSCSIGSWLVLAELQKVDPSMLSSTLEQHWSKSLSELSLGMLTRLLESSLMGHHLV